MNPPLGVGGDFFVALWGTEQAKDSLLFPVGYLDSPQCSRLQRLRTLLPPLVGSGADRELKVRFTVFTRKPSC